MDLYENNPTTERESAPCFSIRIESVSLPKTAEKEGRLTLEDIICRKIAVIDLVRPPLHLDNM